MAFIQHLSSIISISENLEKELNAISEKLTVNKNINLININDRCTDLFFVDKGLLRGYYFLEGKEVTNWFAQENEFATCFYSFVARKNSYEIVQAMEDCELIKLSYSSLQSLYAKFPETERIGRIVLETYYVKLEERLLSIQFKTAKERYKNLFSKNPSLLQRASLGQIASYLGVTQETLSRIRAEA